ncbi:MAG: hypothetical protein ABEI52_10830, partial [Halobacteriaceae archaeon]
HADDMTGRSRISIAAEIFTEDGLLSLLSKSQEHLYRKYLRQFTPKKVKEIEANGVTVPVDIHLLDDTVPRYTPPYPTSDAPLHEQTECQAIREYVGPDDEVIIIGGGLGVTAVVAANETDGRVTIYEQSAETCEILERTIETNGLTEQVE